MIGADSSSARLRTMAAELRAETPRIRRALVDIPEALDALDVQPARTLELYGAAALLDTLYTGVEKALKRVAAGLGAVPDGATWHRDLLEGAALRIAKVRPAVLTEEATRSLEPYLSFRHLFRNLYLFDLEADLLAPLLRDAVAVFERFCAELEVFAVALEASADALDNEPLPE